MLSRQPADIRQFLARTAVLDRFCAPLCEAVAGSSRAAEVIEVLERENLFPAPLDDNPEWYHYHHLFVQVLRDQLTKTEPDIAPILYERARTWHRLSGTPDERSDTRSPPVTRPRLSASSRALDRLRDGGPGRGRSAPGCAQSETIRLALILWPRAQRGVVGMRSLESSAALLSGTFGFDGIRPRLGPLGRGSG